MYININLLAMNIQFKILCFLENNKYIKRKLEKHQSLCDFSFINLDFTNVLKMEVGSKYKLTWIMSKS